MNPRDFYLACLEQASDIVSQVKQTELNNTTPDDEWSVHDLLNHMLYELSWVPDMLHGKTIDEVGSAFDGDLLAMQANNVQMAWQSAARTATVAVQQANLDATAHLSYADVPNGDYLQMSGGDILVHSWDLGKAIGVTVEFSDAVANYMWQRVAGRDMSASGLFKKPLSVSDNASSQDKILAQFGRDSNWQQN